MGKQHSKLQDKTFNKNQMLKKEPIQLGESNMEIKILMLGLDYSGKTSILYRNKLDEVVQAEPSESLNVEVIQYKKIKFIFFDVGGGDKMKPLWRNYLQGTQGLIFVVDSQDKQRIEIAKKELQRILSEDDLKETPLLVFANKNEMYNMNVTQITEKLGLANLTGRKWFVQSTNGIAGGGFFEGLNQMFIPQQQTQINKSSQQGQAKNNMEMNIFVSGIDGAGKSTILQRHILGEVFFSTDIKYYLHNETFEYKKIKFTIGKYWSVFPETQGIIFVVDSSDKERIEIAKEELQRILSEDGLKKASLLVLANKYDIGVMNVTEITESLGLLTLENVNGRSQLRALLEVKVYQKVLIGFLRLSPKRNEIDYQILPFFYPYYCQQIKNQQTYLIQYVFQCQLIPIFIQVFIYLLNSNNIFHFIIFTYSF